MKYISSVHHDDVKHIVSLQNRSYRYEHLQFIAQGTRVCKDLVTRYKPVVIYMTEDYYQSHEFQQLEEIIIGVSDRVMEKISGATTPSGICIIFSMPPTQPLPKSGPGIVLMDINDPGNMGTLIRSAAAMNVNHVILVGGVDPYHPKVIQSTAGCLQNMNIYQTSDTELKKQDLNLCGLIVKNGQNPDSIDFTNTFLVVGNEAHGLSPDQIQLCTTTMTIPMPGNTESLNAAVAGSIGLYIMAQKNSKK
jgi:TrmH family RNA methyltransferase